MPNQSDKFKDALIRRTGLSELVVNAAWPDWWTEDADGSPSALAELRFSLARKLGLDPRTLQDDAPEFFWDDSARFKSFKGKNDRERAAITSFGTSIGRMLLSGCSRGYDLSGKSAAELRAAILRGRPFIGIVDLLALLWSVGIPTIHLRVYPLSLKRMCAMAVRHQDRYAILLARDSVYPAPVAFHLAHEIGHICLGHLKDGEAIVDMDDPSEKDREVDAEEQGADKFALELLTGSPEPNIIKVGTGNNSMALANEAKRLGFELGIEPGTLALCYGHATGDWGVANKSLSHIYDQQINAWSVINQMAKDQLLWNDIREDSHSYLVAVLGG